MSITISPIVGIVVIALGNGQILRKILAVNRFIDNWGGWGFLVTTGFWDLETRILKVSMVRCQGFGLEE